jgi:hypothetical protein
MLNRVLNFLGESVENPHKHSVQFVSEDLKNEIGPGVKFNFVFTIYQIDYKGFVELKESNLGFKGIVEFGDKNKITKEFKELYSDFIIKELKNQLKNVSNSKLII